MDGFSYSNIFDTKGIEYLAIIAFLLLLIPFWMVLNNQVVIKNRIRQAMGFLSSGILTIPQGIFHSRNHTWAFLEKSGAARVGLDELLLFITGEVKVQPLKHQGEMIARGEILARIDQNGKSLNIFSPVSGEIIDPNPAVLINPALLKKDPYGKGWLYTIRPTNWTDEIQPCYLAADATAWLKNELERYKDFIAVNMSMQSTQPALTILQDGGEIAGDSLSGLPAEFWQEFQQEFLNPQAERENNRL